MRPIILSAHKGKLKLRDAERDLLIDFDPRHPDAGLIVIAFNAATTAQDMGYDGIRAVEALPKLIEALNGICRIIELTPDPLSRTNAAFATALKALAQAGQKPRGKDYDTPEGA